MFLDVVIEGIGQSIFWFGEELIVGIVQLLNQLRIYTRFFFRKRDKSLIVRFERIFLSEEVSIFSEEVLKENFSVLKDDFKSREKRDFLCWMRLEVTIADGEEK